MNFDSFSHGQIKSKLWLCESLENHIPNNATIALLGGWYNLLGFIMLARNSHKISSILNIDIESSAIDIANKINNGWMIGVGAKINNIVADACSYNYQGFDVVINCSTEHMSTEWFNNVSYGTLVCIQSSNIVDPNDPWHIVTPSPDIESFKQKYNLSTTLFIDTMRIQYGDWGYDRYMLIGYK